MSELPSEIALKAPDTSPPATRANYAFLECLLAFQVLLAVGFGFLFMDKGSFAFSDWLEPLIQPALYLSVLALSFAAMMLRLLSGRNGAGHFIWIILWVSFTLAMAVAYRIVAGISIPTNFMYLLLGLASPLLYARRRFMFGAAGAAVIANAAYSVCQILSLSGLIDPYGMPVIPMAFQNSDGDATFDIRRASGFYFQPLAAAAIFGFAALIYWRLHKRTGSEFYRIVHYSALLGLALSQSWAATAVVSFFYFLLGGWRLRVPILAAVTTAAAYVLGKDDLQTLIAFIVGEKMSHSGSVKLGLVLKHAIYFLNNPQTFLMGGVFDVGIPFTENTFISLCYQFGVAAAVLLPVLILHQSLSNIFRARSSAARDLRATDEAAKLNLVAIFPCTLMFFQNSALVPPVIMLLVLLLAWNHGDARSLTGKEVIP